jgi:hypothetical protein
MAKWNVSSHVFVLGESILPISTILLLEFGNIPTVWHFFVRRVGTLASNFQRYIFVPSPTFLSKLKFRKNWNFIMNVEKGILNQEVRVFLKPNDSLLVRCESFPHFPEACPRFPVHL